jgi:O-antigen/teichoic acid export membrane protein
MTKRRIFRDGAWVASGQVVTAAVLLIGTRVTTEIVKQPNVMGVVGLLLGLVMTSRNVLCAPILQTQFRFYPEFAACGRVGQLRRMANKTLRPIVLLLVSITLIGGVVQSYWTGISWWTYVVVAGLLIIEVFRGLETNFFQAARRQKAMTAVSVSEAIARPTCMVLMVWWLGISPATVLLGYLIGSGGIYLVLLSGMHREGMGDSAARSEDSPAMPTRGELLRYALPLAPLAVVGTITSISDRYLLGAVLGTAKVGVYIMTYGLMSQPFLLAQGIVSRTLMPIYFKAVSDGHKEIEKKTFRAWLWMTVAICGAGFIGVVLLKGWIARLLLEENYRSGVELMPWIAGGYALYAVGTVYEMRLYARKLTKRVLLGESIVAGAAIVTPLCLMYKWSMLGVAAACPVYFGVMVVVMAGLSREKGSQKA